MSESPLPDTPAVVVDDAAGGRLSRLWQTAVHRSSGTIARGAMWGMLINVGGVGLGMLSQIALAQQLGTAGYGIYVFVLALMNGAAILGKIEMDTAAVRFVGAYHATESWGLLRGFLRKSRRWVNLSSIGLGALGAVIVLVARPLLPAGYFAPLLFGCGLLPLFSRLLLEAAFLQGFRRIRESQAPYQLLRPALLCLAVLVIGASTTHLSVPVAVFLQLFAVGCSLGVTLFLMKRCTPVEARTAVEVDDSSEWLRTAGPLLVIALSQLILSSQTDVLVVTAFLGKEATALYGSASQIALLISFAFTAFMLIVQPQIARLFAQKRIEDLQLLVSRVQLASLLASLGVYVVIVLFGRWILGLFGTDFRAAYAPMLVLGLGQLFLASVGAVAGYLLTMTGHQKEASRVIAGTAIFNLMLTVVLTPAFGIVGAAAATSTAVFVRAAILAVIVRRTVGINLFRLPRNIL